MKTTLQSVYAKKDVKVLIGNFFSLIVLRGFDFLIPLITFPYIVKVIGIENFGLVNFALAFSIYFGALIQYGFSVTATRDIARSRDDKVKLEFIYSVTLTTSIILAIFSFIIYSLVVLFFDKFSEHQLLYWLTFLSIAFKSLFPIWLFQGVERMKYITYLSLLSKLVFIGSLFFVIREESDYIYIPVLNGIAALLSLIAAIFIIYKEFNIKYTLPLLKDVWTQLVYGRHAFVNQFVPNLYSNSTVFLLGVFTNNTVVGVFSAATKVIDLVGSLAYIFSNACFPYMSRNIDKHNVFKVIMLVAGLLLMILLILTADILAQLLFNDVSENVAYYICILSPVIPLIFIQLTFGANYLMLIDKESLVKNITLSVSIFSLSYSVAGIYYYGIYGAIFTLVFTRVIMSSMYYFNYIKLSR